MRTPLLRRAALAVACAFPAALPAQGQQQLDIHIARDEYGIPHIEAPTAAKAFHGLGYIAATDRLFQMEFFRRAMRGTLAEIFSNTTHATAKDSDVRARALGFARFAAEATAAIQVSNPSDHQLLVAYADGINKRLAEVRTSGSWPYMFQNLGVQQMADWTPTDCVLVWMYAAESTVHWKDVGHVEPPNQIPDIAGAVLPTGGNGTFAFLAVPNGHLLAALASGGEMLRRADAALRGTPASPAIKASHHIVFHGSETATAKPTLLGKPQHRVGTPSTHYEFALKGGAYDFRGAGFPGSPGVLHGWNRELAWSLTGMGGDNCDVYKVAFTDATHTSYYVRNLQGVQVLHQVTDVANETVVVRDGTNVTIKHARTIWGPLVTSLVGGTPPPVNVGYAVRSQIFDECKAGRVPLLASLQLMRATDKATVVAATRGWSYPGAHVLVALKQSPTAGETRGAIGYRSLLAVPLRPHAPPANLPWGREVLNGNLLSHAWPGTIAYESMPAVLGSLPFLSTANNLATDPARLPQPYVLGSIGANARSWRLTEIGDQMVSGAPITLADHEQLDRDMVDPVLREFVLLARAMRLLQVGGVSLHGGAPLSGSALAFLDAIAAWGGTDWNMDAVAYPGVFALLVALTKDMTLSPAGGPAATGLESIYGARDAGALRLLRTVSETQGGAATFYQSLDQTHGAELENWVQYLLRRAYALDKSQFETAEFTLLHQWNLKPLSDQPGVANQSNWVAANGTVQGLRAMHAGTVWSQIGEAYKFVADVANPDNNKALLAPGVSEDPASPLYLNNLDRWKNGTMYPAPITWGSFQVTQHYWLAW